MIDSTQHSNIAEEEMGQLHGSIHLHENAIAKVRASMKSGPSLIYCKDCGNKIPEARRSVIQGCDTCVRCQTLNESQARK